MAGTPDVWLKVVQLGQAVEDCLQAARDHPNAAPGLLKAAASYEAQERALLDGIVERNNRLRATMARRKTVTR